jgi:hypothetical protein
MLSFWAKRQRMIDTAVHPHFSAAGGRADFARLLKAAKAKAVKRPG